MLRHSALSTRIDNLQDDHPSSERGNATIPNARFLDWFPLDVSGLFCRIHSRMLCKGIVYPYFPIIIAQFA